jgi:hypothetical protein
MESEEEQAMDMDNQIGSSDCQCADIQRDTVALTSYTTTPPLLLVCVSRAAHHARHAITRLMTAAAQVETDVMTP